MYDFPQPSDRTGFITGLRELADFLDQHPDVPVPEFGTEINLHVAYTEDGGRIQVNRIAGQLGASISDDTADGGHLTATRMFGPVGYTVVSIPATVMAIHHAHSTYRGCVTPDMP